MSNNKDNPFLQTGVTLPTNASSALIELPPATNELFQCIRVHVPFVPNTNAGGKGGGRGKGREGEGKWNCESENIINTH